MFIVSASYIQSSLIYLQSCFRCKRMLLEKSKIKSGNNHKNSIEFCLLLLLLILRVAINLEITEFREKSREKLLIKKSRIFKNYIALGVWEKLNSLKFLLQTVTKMTRVYVLYPFHMLLSI